MSLFSSVDNNGSGVFGDIIKYQQYTDSRTITNSLNEAQVKQIKGMSIDMERSSKLERLGKWQSLYKAHKEEDSTYTKTLSEFITDFKDLLDLV